MNLLDIINSFSYSKQCKNDNLLTKYSVKKKKRKRLTLQLMGVLLF